MQFHCLTWITHFCNQILSRYGDEDETGDIDLIPDHVLFKILTLLPANELRTKRRVCRKWRALISGRDFEELRVNRSPSIILLQYLGSIFYSLNDKVELVQRQFVPWALRRMTGNQIDPPVLLGCFNGLLLFRRQFFTYNSEITFYVWNPIYREAIILTITGYLCALFVHPSTKEYKLLQVCETGEDSCYTYLVCNLAVGPLSWKQVGRFTYKPKWDKIGLIRGKFLYWVIEQFYAYNISPCSESIMFLDMDTEEFRAMPHPGRECQESESRESHINMELLESDSSLAFSIRCDKYIQLWILVDHVNWNWVRKCTINLLCWPLDRFPFSNQRTFRFIIYNYDVKPFEVHGNELLLLWEHRGLFKYNIETGNIRKIKMPKSQLLTTHMYWWIVRYVENLASLESLSAKN